MFIRNNQAFHTTSHHDGVSPMSFDRHLVANLLVSVYSGVFKEPLPDRLERLVHELEIRHGVTGRRAARLGFPAARAPWLTSAASPATPRSATSSRTRRDSAPSPWRESGRASPG